MGTSIRPEVSKKNDYYISRHRYYELKHFCLQYPEWRQSLRSLDGSPRVSPSVVEIRTDGNISDPTAIYAHARIHYRERIEMVECAATNAAGDLGGLMLRAVTEGLSFETISPPCCKEVWYTAYRRFFWLLDKARR